MTDPKARPAFSSANFQAIQLWKDGLNEKDYDKLKSALDAGIPVRLKSKTTTRYIAWRHAGF